MRHFAAARLDLNAAGDPEDDEEEEKKKPEEDEEDEENDGEEEEVPWQVAGPNSAEREVRGQFSQTPFKRFQIKRDSRCASHHQESRRNR